MEKLNLDGIFQIKEDLDKKILNSFITNVVVVNSHDILLTFSFYNKEKLLISLNHSSPFLGFVPTDFNAHTVLGQLNDNLRKYLKGSYIIAIDVLNNDRVLKFTLHKSNDFYEKETYYLVLELIPTISNLIFLDSKENIIFAKHYSDLTASRPIIQKMKYVPLTKNKELERGTFNYTKYNEDISKYVLDSINLKQKEKALPLYNHLKTKIKSLKRKIKVLENELEDAKNKLVYKEYGEALLTYKDDKEELEMLITTIPSYDKDLSVEENATSLFNKYKKYKRTIENDNREIDIANKEIEEYERLLSIFEYLSEEEILELSQKYLPKQTNKKSKQLPPSNAPYYVEYNKVRIGFGKNKEQNNVLTFKKANKEDIFIHVANYSASHVVIFSNNVNKDTLLVGLEIALLLSGKVDAELQVSKIKDIKKGQSTGQVLLNKYETYNLREARDSTKKLLLTQKRF